MYTHTIICHGAEIGASEAETFDQARDEAEAQAAEAGAWYPRDDWGYIATNPAGMTVTYNV